MIKLAIVTTHPIQYNAPWFRLLAQEPGVRVKVFYTWSQSQKGAKYDPGFGKVVEWDIPLLSGYEYEFIDNISTDPGSHHFSGINNPTLNKCIEKWQPDAVLVLGWCYKSHLSCMRYFKGRVPVLFRGDSTLLSEKPGPKKWMRRLFLKYIYSYVDYALYVGTNNKEYYSVHGLKEHQLFYVPHAIDNDRFNSDGTFEMEARNWRRSLNIKNNEIVVLYAGKFDEPKNPQFVLQIAESTINNKIKFVLVGNGPLEKYLKERASRDERVIFIDFQNQKKMPVVYRLGDVVILPSKNETWGLAINEAMACGRAVMASNKCGCSIDLIKPEVNGCIFDNQETSEIASYLNGLASNTQKLVAMGEASRNLIKSFSFETIVRNTVLLLNELKDRH